MSQSLETWLWFHDAHIPFHNVKAWNIMLNVAADLNVDGISNVGDMADFYAVSSHRKDPNRMLGFDKELEVVNECFDELDSLGAKRKEFFGGNHEDRLIRYLQDRAPELFNLVQIPDLFHLEDRGWEYTPYKESKQIGKIWATHDIGVSTKYAVFRAAETFMHSNVTGHTHRMTQTIQGDATGKKFISTSFGWLGDPEQCDYMHKVKARRDWANGFGIGYMNKDTGDTYFQPIPIFDDQAVVNGKIYKP